MNKNLRKKMKETDDFFSRPVSSGEGAWGMIHELVHQILTHYPKARIPKEFDTDKSIHDFAKLLKKYNLKVEVKWIPEEKN